jgi:hypothetical protein
MKHPLITFDIDTSSVGSALIVFGTKQSTDQSTAVVTCKGTGICQVGKPQGLAGTQGIFLSAVNNDGTFTIFIMFNTQDAQQNANFIPPQSGNQYLIGGMFTFPGGDGSGIQQGVTVNAGTNATFVSDAATNWGMLSMLANATPSLHHK